MGCPQKAGDTEACVPPCLRDGGAEPLDGQDTEEIPQRLDPTREAHTLLALADGLTVHVLAGHHSPEMALAILQRHIDHLLQSASGHG
ncbi:TetR family transcriptional regulator C-terminal domain-containing protein [Streptomyces sp. NRRL S-481]|uniref:TetR family transcriptional regulator C-terminal domain-containing protein n=1 Tax=Streptomyces sp. NRRL S-481 TaxID=1463911 RepID=UPI003B63CA70